MGLDQWKNSFVLVAIAISGLSLPLNAVPKPKNPILLQSAQGSDADLTLISPTTPVAQQNTLTIKRLQMAEGKTSQSRFGVMSYEGKFICYTLERENVKIPAGTYRAELRWSGRFQRIVPYILVPSHNGIEIHPGNCPRNSGGCVLVGTEIRGACLYNSRQAFAAVVAALPQTFTVIIE